jgi:hypothetical protein
MEPYTESAARTFKLNSNDDWLRKRQGLALPALPPTTLEARKYFFTKIREFSEVATADKKKKVNFEAFAQEWNRTADGKERFYVTFEVLSAYAKSWEKANNVRASQELISSQLQEVKKTAEIFLAPGKPFPSYLTSAPNQIQPSRGVITIEDSAAPSSLSTELSPSHPVSRPTFLNAFDHVGNNLGCFSEMSCRSGNERISESSPTLTAPTDTNNSEDQSGSSLPITQAIQDPLLQDSRNPSWYVTKRCRFCNKSELSNNCH